jgi:predicted nuclease of predicted toxin-antitoxin system
MKLLIDMNLSPRWVGFFAGATIQADHWSSLGVSSAPDTEIMDYARVNAYIVLTNDLDFGAILAATHGAKPSVLQIRGADLRPESIGDQVLLALTCMTAELEEGALVSIDPKHTRLRMLPLKRKS